MRKTWLLIALLSAALGLRAGAARAEHYDVFILAGQSNMDGRAPVTGLTGDLAKWKEPQKDVALAYSDSNLRGRYLTSDGWKPLEPGYSVAPLTDQKITKVPAGTFGPELAFGRTMADALKPAGGHVAIIKFAEGGTSLQKDWGVGEKAKLYDQMIQFITKSLGELKDRGDTCDVKGFVWHQGESDSTESQATYAGLLTDLITHVRHDLQPYRGTPAATELPVVIGEVFDNGQRNTIIAAQKQVAKDLPACALAPSTGLNTLDNGTHFDAPSQLELGKRMADAMQKLLQPKSHP